MKLTINGDECDGHCDKEKKLITMAEPDNNHEYTATLLHELFHGAFYESALGQTSIDEDIEEIIVEQFAKVLLDNFDIKPKGGK